jgi:dihydrofolate reductase
MLNISFIVAMGSNRVIGCENRLPWHMPADMRRFRRLTMGKTVLMGRQTHDSIGKPLVGRHNVVLTRNREYRPEGCTVVHSIEEALQVAGSGELMVIGGAQIYEQMLPMANQIYLTLIDGQFEGDTIFPMLSPAEWKEVSREICAADAKNAHNYVFIELERRY